MIRPLAVLVVLVLAALPACSDEYADHSGIPVVRPTGPAPPERESEQYVFGGVDGLRKVLETRVLRSAGVVKPVRSECDVERPTPRFTCTVDYDGERVTYLVTTSGSGWAEWEATTDSLVMTRAGVLAAVWREYSAHAAKLRCEDGIPETARVAPGTKLGQRCYFKPGADHPVYGEDSRIGGYPDTVAADLVVANGDIFVVPEKD
ncbi:hypothetical protein GCM10023320_84330 [Pseudonocardia adelaidensis]|uniref:DUF4333 domain-containing protein n=1 Tax=Pseudonocardia adelaidensis TaxID=648754 RepID=A0ABP9PAQ0_9PSEU